MSDDLAKKVSYPPDTHRLLPQSSDAEAGALASLLLDPGSVCEFCVAQKLTHAIFHQPGNAVVFDAAMKLWQDKKPIDFILLTASLRETDQLSMAGGMIKGYQATGASYLTELFTFLPTAANHRYYFDILIDLHSKRELIRVCTEYAARAYEETEPGKELVANAETDILAINFQVTENQEEKTTFTVVEEAVEAINAMFDRKGSIGGIPTGFYAFDTTTDGLHDTDMIVVAGRPSMGKTALAMNVAEHVGVTLKLPVAVFSLEMSTPQLAKRLILSRARVSLVRAREGHLAERDTQAVSKAASEIARSPIYFDDKSGVSIGYVGAKLRRWKRKYGIRFAMIDYLQLLRGVKTYKGDNRQGEVAEISGGIKALAKELGIPILVLAQLSRQPESRQGGIPRLSDLRDTGAIEQDADLVGLLHREEYYAEGEEEKAKVAGKAKLIIGKQRNGPTGEVELVFLKDFARFENMAKVR